MIKLDKMRIQKNLIDKYKDKKEDNNVIISENFYVSRNWKQHFKALNMLVLGGTGSGKTRAHVKSNILQMNASYVIYDPCNNIYEDTADMLRDNGYDVYKFSCVSHDTSNKYNPLTYLKTDKDIDNFAKILVDCHYDFCLDLDKSIKREVTDLLCVIIKDFLNSDRLKTIPELQDYVEKYLDDDEKIKSIIRSELIIFHCNLRVPIDIIKKICKSHLSLCNDTEKEIDLNNPEFYKKKTAIFIRAGADSYIMSVFMDQIMSILYDLEDRINPYQIHFLLDEFANCPIIPDFRDRLACFHGKNTAFSIILQSIIQLKSMYPDNFVAIEALCPFIIWLGGDEVDTTEYISGKIKTIKPKKIKHLDWEKMIIYIYGEDSIIDNKFKIEDHKNYNQLKY